MSDGGNNNSENDTIPVGKWQTEKHLLLYLIYAGIVLMAGLKLGAFHKRAAFSEADIAAAQKSMVGLPKTQAPINPLADGILVFDAETKQTTVHEGDEQAHFVFNFTNISSKDVIINAVTTSCGCTTAELPQMPWSLPPHAKGRIPITMNVLGHTGKVAKTVTVVAAQGAKTLNVEANILQVANTNNAGAL